MGALKLHGGTKDQGIRDQGIRSGARGGGGGGGRGEGTGAEGVGGEGSTAAPGCRLRLFPAAAGPPAAASIVCGPALPQVRRLPPAFASRCPAAPRILGIGSGLTPAGRWSGRCLDSWAGPSPQPLLGLFPSTPAGDRAPRPSGMAMFQFLGPEPGYTGNPVESGTWKD